MIVAPLGVWSKQGQLGARVTMLVIIASHLLLCSCPVGRWLMIKFRGIFVILHPPPRRQRVIFICAQSVLWHCGIDAPTGNTNLNPQGYQVG